MRLVKRWQSGASALLIAACLVGANAQPSWAESATGANPNDTWRPVQADPENPGRHATWESCDLTYAVDMGTLVNTRTDLAKVSAEIDQAFNKWSEGAAQIGRQLRFTRLPDVAPGAAVFDPERVEAEPRGTPADILIAFLDEKNNPAVPHHWTSKFQAANTESANPSEGSAALTGVEFRWGEPMPTLWITDIDMAINVSAVTGRDFDAYRPKVIVHEIGHALGFGHNDNPASIMSYNSKPSNTTLSNLEREGLATLYAHCPPIQGSGGQVTALTEGDVDLDPSRQITDDALALVKGQQVTVSEHCWSKARGRKAPMLQVLVDATWQTVARGRLVRNKALCPKSKYPMVARYTFTVPDVGVLSPDGYSFTAEYRTMSGSNTYPFTKVVLATPEDLARYNADH